MTPSKKIPADLIESLLSGYEKPEDLLGENGLLEQLSKALVERAWQAEMAEHLKRAQHDPEPKLTRNPSNDDKPKRFKGKSSEVRKEIRRDRHDNFEPKTIAKHSSRWPGFNHDIISLYANGLTVLEIQNHLQKQYGVEVSPSLIASVTHAFANEIKTWHSRPLEPIYPLVYLDCIHIKVRDDVHTLRVKTAYIAIGVNLAGKKDVLGLWIAQTEAANLCLQVITDLKHRGVQDIFIACVDGLKGVPEVLHTAYPHATVQLCISHLMRSSLNHVNWKMRKPVEGDLKRIYQSTNLDEAEQELVEFKNKWGGAYPSIALIWHSCWDRVVSFFDYPPEIRRLIYATRSIESVTIGLRKITDNHDFFPSDDALSKLLYLALMNISKKWTLPVRDWKAALNRLGLQFKERMPNQ